MHEGPYLIPAGAPPGSPLLTEEERPPEAVYYFRIYAVLMVLLLMAEIVAGLYFMLGPVLSGMSGSTLTSGAGEWVLGLFMAVIGFVLLVPHVIAIFGGRQKWVYTLSIVLIGMSMLLNTCCLPVTIPLLIYMMKPETKRWFGAS
jgi:hypothetical protein